MELTNAYQNLVNVVNQLLSIPDIENYKATNKDDFSSLIISLVTYNNMILYSKSKKQVHDAFLLLSDLVNKKPELTGIKELIIDVL